MKKPQTLSLNGQQFEILDLIRMDCHICHRSHKVFLLSRDFSFTVGNFGYRAKHECYYCSASGEIFIDEQLKARNQQAINNIVDPHSRGASTTSRI